MYKLTNFNSIIRIADNAIIPVDLENGDYIDYLAWLEDGNEPEAADALIEITEQAEQPATLEQKLAEQTAQVEALQQQVNSLLAIFKTVPSSQ